MFNEVALLKYLNSFPAKLTLIPYLLSFLGSLSFIVALLTFLVIIRKNKEAWVLFLASLVNTGTVFLLKQLIKRKRPFLVEKGVNALLKVKGYSFPSGHASLSFLLATIFSGFYKEGKYLFILAGLVALSRVILGVHYPTDVLAGGLLGFIVGKLVLKYEGEFKLYEKLMDRLEQR